MAARFDASYTGIGEMLRAEFIEADMLARATKVLAAAVADAPFDPGSHDGTHYKDAFRLEHSRTGDRARARVVNDDTAAFQIEWGTSDTPAHHTLGRALDAARD